MKVLLDESVPVQLHNALPQHAVSSVSSMEWKGVENGALLAAAELAAFYLLVLADKNLRYQQNLEGRAIAIVELWTNHRPTLERHFSYIEKTVSAATPGSYAVVAPP